MQKINASTQKLTIELSRYLSETLGGSPQATPWTGARKLQFMLQDAYHFMELSLHGRPFIAMVDKLNEPRPAKMVGKHIQNLAKDHPDTFIFVTTAMTSIERRRYIEKGVQFIVPGNQMFVPSLGIDLREYFRKRAIKVEAMGPATQAMIIGLLCREPAPIDAAEEKGRGYLTQGLDYSRMTLSRSVKELETLGLLELVDSVRTCQVYGKEADLNAANARLWQAARPMMKSPVKRVAWLSKVPTCTFASLLVSGEWALAFVAEETMLNYPRLPVYALSASQFDAVLKNGKAFQTEEEDAVCEIEIWSYEPKAFRHWGPSVDGFSLVLSFEGTHDPRLEMCVSEIEEIIASR